MYAFAHTLLLSAIDIMISLCSAQESINDGDAGNDVASRMAGTEVEVGESGMGFTDTPQTGPQYNAMLYRLETCAMGSTPEFTDAVDACFEQEPVGDMGPLASATATAVVDGLMETLDGAMRARTEVADLRAKLAEAEAQLATLRAKAMASAGPLGRAGGGGRQG